MLADRMDRHDVRVPQPRDGPRLVQEPLDLLARGIPRLGQGLERHDPPQPDIASPVDHPHAPAADLPLDLVTGELGQRPLAFLVVPRARASPGSRRNRFRLAIRSRSTGSQCNSSPHRVSGVGSSPRACASSHRTSKFSSGSPSIPGPDGADSPGPGSRVNS